jgi:heme oxygenase
MQETSRRWLLRERTAEAHAAVDTAVGGFADLLSYKSYLSAISAFRIPLERQLGAVEWPHTLEGWRPNRVAEAIAADMDDLGVAPIPAATGDLPLDGDRLYGILYVLEGSSLGARLLFRRAQALGLSENHGARHLALLGGSSDGWRGFLERLERAQPFDIELAVDASMAAFNSARVAFGVR